MSSAAPRATEHDAEGGQGVEARDGGARGTPSVPADASTCVDLAQPTPNKKRRRGREKRSRWRIIRTARQEALLTRAACSSATQQRSGSEIIAADDQLQREQHRGQLEPCVAPPVGKGQRRHTEQQYKQKP